MELAVKSYWDESHQKSTIPVSEVDLEEFHSWMQNMKSLMAPIDADVKDAKRRVNAAKGKAKKAKVETVADQSDDDVDTDGEV